MWGRKDIGTGLLRNLTNGGDGSGAIRKPESTAKALKTRLEKYGTLSTVTPEVVTKSIATKIKNGTLNTQNPESVRKQIETKIKKYGTLKTSTPESIAKGLETKKQNGSFNHSPEARERMRQTRLERRIKPSLESLAKGLATKRARGNDTAGRYWWTNGSSNKRSKECPGPDWRPGITR